MRDFFITKIFEVAGERRGYPYWEMILAVAGDERREAYLPLIRAERDPRELIPAIYKLLNPEWYVV